VNVLFGIAAVATPLLASQYLGNGGFIAFPLAALLLLACALRARRRTRAQARDERVPQAYERVADMGAPARPRDERGSGRARTWALCVMGVAAGLGALVWALGLLVTGLGLGLLIAASIFFLHTRRRVAEFRVIPLSTPLDRNVWLDELPGRVADAVDAARLVRGHADAAGAYAAESGEGAA
jgi:hypothetical protein